MGITPAEQRVGNFININFFLLDVAITNVYILLSKFSTGSFKDVKSFRLLLAKQLIGEYCSRGRGRTVIHPLPFRHYPIRLDDPSEGPMHRRGPCAFHRDNHHR